MLKVIRDEKIVERGFYNNEDEAIKRARSLARRTGSAVYVEDDVRKIAVWMNSEAKMQLKSAGMLQFFSDDIGKENEARRREARESY